MGGTHSRDCNQITRETILWCKDRDISLTITHLPVKLNAEADKAGREFHDDSEWSLDAQVYQTLVSRWGKPDVDLFASRLNAKIPLARIQVFRRGGSTKWGRRRRRLSRGVGEHPPTENF